MQPVTVLGGSFCTDGCEVQLQSSHIAPESVASSQFSNAAPFPCGCPSWELLPPFQHLKFTLYRRPPLQNSSCPVWKNTSSPTALGCLRPPWISKWHSEFRSLAQPGLTHLLAPPSPYAPVACPSSSQKREKNQPHTRKRRNAARPPSVASVHRPVP